MLPRIYEDMFDFLPEERGPRCDIYEKDGKYHLEMDLPGYKKDEIRVDAHKGTIIISAKRDFKKDENEDKKYLRRERHYSKVERSFYLGEIDEDNITAEFKDGILRVTIPTKPESGKKQISIN